MVRVVKMEDLAGKKTASKEETEGLRGRVIILDTEKSEIAKNLEIKEKGVFGIRFR